MSIVDAANGALTSENTAVDAAALPETAAIVRWNTVVVLPFVDDSPARDQDYFCRGTAQEIIHALMNLNIRVLMPKGDPPLNTIANASDSSKEVNGAMTIAGSVRKFCNLYRISILLVDRASGRVVWSERLDRNIVDVFSLQEEIARTVTEALRGKFAAQNEEAGEAHCPMTTK